MKTKCESCIELHSNYVGDGFDSFYEWKCKLSKLKLIGYDEPFHHCKTPKWCPKNKKRKLK